MLPITTKRLILRRMTPQDIPALQRIGGDPRVAPNLFSVISPWPAEAVEHWIETSQFADRLGFRLGIALRDRPDELIGTVGIGGAPVSLSYFVDLARNDQGFATEAAGALLQFCRDAFQLRSVTADYYSDNPASGRVLTKLGFVHVGQDVGTSPARAGPAPITLMRLDLP
ncbi:GNAT family N-acetyltransferase [Loktanella sp. 3ANDIMAR09]|uniref:GNAT family N-acetyltransferase n=1 Tax=Loktanella sp. 3ANDIMAR09 TaxID=1225657 RepID=UPI0006F5BD8B|nr:GNAT family N-acetyltransferase [Loktanella sp. 3ANDIMAR09]